MSEGREEALLEAVVEDVKVEPLIRQRKLGTTGLLVSELSLGTWGLSGEGYGPVTSADAEATIELALELGITLFDTSDVYEKGGMEERLGRLLEKRADDVFVCTRHGVDRSQNPPRRHYGAEYLSASLEATRKRLRRDVVDVFLLHNPAVDALVNGQTKPYLEEMKARGKIRAWGVSAGDVEVARVALQVGVDVIEFPYNVINSADLHTLVGEIAEKPAGVLAHSVLSYGLLAGMWHASKIFPEGDHRRDRWTKAELSTRIDQLEAVRALLSENVHTMRAAALRFVLENQIVTSAVLGPRNVAQLEQLVRDAGKGPTYLDPTRLARLPSRMVAVGLDP